MNDSRRTRDAWLALRCQGREPDAFAQLVEEFQSPLIYYALKLTGNWETAKEVVQESWIKALRGIHSLQDPSSVRAWLYRMVHGLAVDRVRRDLARERAEDRGEETEFYLDESWFHAANAEAVHHAIDQLSPKHREVIVLYFLEDFTLAEIGHVTRCQEGTVKSRLHYAKAALKTVLLTQKL